MVSGVLNLSFAFKESQYPPIASGYWIAVCIAQEINAVFHCFEIFLLTKVPIGLRVIEYKTCAADQVAGDGIIDGNLVPGKRGKNHPRNHRPGGGETPGLPHLVPQDNPAARARGYGGA